MIFRTLVVALSILGLTGCSLIDGLSGGDDDGSIEPPVEPPIEPPGTVDAGPVGFRFEAFSEPIPVDSNQFQAPENITGIFEDDPSLTGDLLTMYFSSNRDDRNGPEKLFVVERSSVDQPWGSPETVLLPTSGTDSDGAEVILDFSLGVTDPFISLDGLTLWFAYPSTRQVPDTLSRAIFQVTRPSTTSRWANLQRQTSLDTFEWENPGSVTADGLTIVFDSQPRELTVPRSSIHLATRDDPGGDFALVMQGELDQVNSDCRDTGPYATPDGNILMWSSETNACQPSRLQIATRDPNTNEFIADPDLQAVLDRDITSDLAEDLDPWLAPDGSYLVFARKLEDSGTGHRLFEARRLDP